MSNYDFNEELMKAVSFQRLGPYMMQEKYDRKNGIGVAPDTVGVDYFFLLGFMTPQMELDFPVIEHEFLEKCRTKLAEFNTVGWYGVADISVYNPIQSLHINILRLIYNGAKAGDDYCVELLKSLYKTYHKKEYNQLKRFKELSGEDVINLSENLENPMEEKMTTARVLAMASFMGKVIDEKCFIFYYSLMEDRKTHIAIMDDLHLETNPISPEKYKEYTDLLNEWMREAKEKYNSKDDIYKSYIETTRFIAECFKQLGFSDDYMQLCTDEDDSRLQSVIHALAILKKLNPKKKYTLNDAYIYSCIVQLINAFTDIVSDYDFEVGYLLGDQLDESELDDVLFKTNSIIINENEADAKSVKLVNIAPIADSNINLDDCIIEIDDLRGKLKVKDQEIKYLREKYRTAKLAEENATNAIAALEADRDELIALRNFVYNLKDEELPEEDELTKMKEALDNKRIVIIGGHPNWHKKLKKIFPAWTLIHMDDYKTVTPSMLENHEYAFFYSDYLSHKSYNKCVAMLREKKMPFGYLHGVNPDVTIKQVYEALE